MNNGNGLIQEPAKRIRWSAGDGLAVDLAKCQDPKVLFDHWPWISDRLRAVRKKDNSIEQWQPDHVRIQILEGLAGRSAVELWFGINSEQVIEGFIVTSVKFDPFVQLPVAWTVWIGWANLDLLAKLSPKFEQIARERYYPRIEFITGRRGWIDAKKAAALGYTVKRIVYGKEL